MGESRQSVGIMRSAEFQLRAVTGVEISGICRDITDSGGAIHLSKDVLLRIHV